MDLRCQSLLTCPSVRIRMHFYSLSHFPHFAKLVTALYSSPPAAKLIEAIPPERSRFFIQIVFRPLLSPTRSLFDELFELINTLEDGRARGSYTIKGKSNVNEVSFLAQDVPLIRKTYFRYSYVGVNGNGIATYFSCQLSVCTSSLCPQKNIQCFDTLWTEAVFQGLCDENCT